MAAEFFEKKTIRFYHIDTDITKRSKDKEYETGSYVNPTSREVLLTITGFTSD